MKINDIYKKLAILEKKVEFLESKLKLKNSSDSREEKWNEFQSILGFKKKIIAEKFLTKTASLDCNSFNTIAFDMWNKKPKINTIINTS